ncbi:MAG: hypothetical protein LUG21_06670 [Clostridiales bacterium]|nr:hypothetical protein [Clostridiales bacterium]
MFAYSKLSEIDSQNTIISEINAIYDIAENDDIQYYSQVDKSKLFEIISRRVVKGKYANVESAVKDYYSNLYTDIFSAVDFGKDNKYQNLLTSENIKNDGPDFTKSKEYIAQFKEVIASAETNYNNDMTDESIMSYAEKYNLSAGRLDFYKQIMIPDTAYDAASSQYLISLNSFDKDLDTYNEALSYLSENKDSWEMDGNTLLFNSQSDLDEYNKIIAPLNLTEEN